MKQKLKDLQFCSFYQVVLSSGSKLKLKYYGIRKVQFPDGNVGEYLIGGVFFPSLNRWGEREFLSREVNVNTNNIISIDEVKKAEDE